MKINHIRDVQPLEAELTDEQIAAKLSAAPSRYSDQPLTVSQIAANLSAAGEDGAGIVDRVLTAMDGIAESNRLVKNKVMIADTGGSIALGNPLQRAMFQQFATAGLITQADADALLSLATVPEAITEADVARSRVVYAADEYVSRVHSAIQTEQGVEGYTAASIAAAVVAVEL